MAVGLAKRLKRSAFDRVAGLEIAQALFHAKGYDAVSIADLTRTLNIKPPSLYAAYGSKPGLFTRVLRIYTAINSDFFDEILKGELSPVEAITSLFVTAAIRYTANPERPGCLITEAMRADDPKVAALASEIATEGEAKIRTYIAAHAAPENAERILNYVLVNLRGLSSFACLGHAQADLIDCSKIAGRALEGEFR